MIIGNSSAKFYQSVPYLFQENLHFCRFCVRVTAPPLPNIAPIFTTSKLILTAIATS